MLCIKNRRCLVVGGGRVAARKIKSLFEEGAKVTVVAPSVVSTIAAMADNQQISLAARPYAAGEAAEYLLVFAATDDREVNRQVFADCEEAGVWVNVADDPELCSFHVPAQVRRGDLHLALASAGTAPFAVRRLREVLQRRLGPGWGQWLAAAAEFRALVRDRGLSQPEQEDRYQRFFASTVDQQSLVARVPSADEWATWLSGDQPARPRPGPEIGQVTLVGSGPGGPGLLTVRGRQRLLQAQCVVYDRLAAGALPPELDSSVELHCVGKSAGHHPVPQEEINALLVRLARQGRRVVRLKGGDPYVFGRGGEEAEALASEAIPFEVIPGVTSGIAGPGWAGIPVTQRGEAVQVTLFTAHEAANKDVASQLQWQLLATPHSTLVGYMGVAALPRVVESLLAAGMNKKTPAALIERATTAAQRRVVADLGGLEAAVAAAGVGPPALLVIGPTVAHAERLDWFSRLPLAGQRLLVPLAAVELASAAERAGAEVVAVPQPVTPAARVVMAAAPLSGCLVLESSVAQWDEERAGEAWQGEMTAWCVGLRAAQAARQRSWPQVVELSPGRAQELVAQICERLGR